MNFHLVCLVISTICCSGFLFDEINTPAFTGSGSGSGLTDQHYITVMDMIAQEKQLRERYMIQLKQKLMQTDNRTLYLESEMDHIRKVKDMHTEVERLKNLTEKLEYSYHSLENKYLLVIKENNQLLKELNSNKQSLTELNSTKQELSEIKEELNNLKSLKSINELKQMDTLRKNTSDLQHQIHSTNNRVDAILATQQARAQDFLALFNRTVSTNSVVSQLQTTQNQSYSHLELEIKQGVFQLENKISKVEESQNRSMMNIQKHVRDINKKVALTICASGTTVSTNNPILFKNVVTSYGIDNLSDIKTSGEFICNVPGLYLVILTVMSNTYDAFFHIYRNSEYLVDLYIQHYADKNYFSGTATVVVKMAITDHITVKAFKSSVLYGRSGRQSTCLAVVKI